MLAFLGDIHGNFKPLVAAAKRASANGATALIQVGDFGFTRDALRWCAKQRFPLPTYAIDGNHEHHEVLEQRYLQVLGQNLWYVPRGTVLTLGGQRVGFLGGADSVDKAYRLRMGWHWSPGEVITPEDCHRMVHAGPVDLWVTHTPPQSVIAANFDPTNLLRFGLPTSWTGDSSPRLDRVWEHLGYPPIVCGHMHESVIAGNVRVLTINEYYER